MPNLFPEALKPIIPYDWNDVGFTFESASPESAVVQTRQGRERRLMHVQMRFPKRPVTDYQTLYEFYTVTVKGKAGRFTFTDFHGWDRSPVGIYWPKQYAGQGDSSAVAFTLPSYAATSRTLYVNDVAQTEAAYSATRARSGTTVTLVTQSAHGYSSGNSVTITGLGGTGFNGTFTITVTNATTFTYTSGTSGTVTTTADTGGVITTSARWVFTASGAADGRRDLATFGTAPTSGHYLRFTFTGRRAFNARFLSDAWSGSSFAAKLHQSGLELLEVDG